MPEKKSQTSRKQLSKEEREKELTDYLATHNLDRQLNHLFTYVLNGTIKYLKFTDGKVYRIILEPKEENKDGAV